MFPAFPFILPLFLVFQLQPAFHRLFLRDLILIYLYQKTH